MVEHHLAKVRVAGSNPVVRSKLNSNPLKFVHNQRHMLRGPSSSFFQNEVRYFTR